jgi:hypothetical protein
MEPYSATKPLSCCALWGKPGFCSIESFIVARRVDKGDWVEYICSTKSV